MIEIALIQRFLLFLGEPVYTFAVVLAGLLGFTESGLGSSAASLQIAVCRLVWIIRGNSACTSVDCLRLAMDPRIGAWVSHCPYALASWWPCWPLLDLRLACRFRPVCALSPSRRRHLCPGHGRVNGFFTVVGSIAASILGMVSDSRRCWL